MAEKTLNSLKELQGNANVDVLVNESLHNKSEKTVHADWGHGFDMALEDNKEII
jgi:hypothetical protein